MSTLAIIGTVLGAYVVVITFTYALMKTASDVDDAVEKMFQHDQEGSHVHDDCGC